MILFWQHAIARVPQGYERSLASQTVPGTLILTMARLIEISFLRSKISLFGIVTQSPTDQLSPLSCDEGSEGNEADENLQMTRLIR